MVKAKEDYKLQLDNELTIKMTNKVRAEVEVARVLWEKELEKTMTTVAKWRAEMEERLKEKDALIDGLKRELAEYKDKSEKDKDDQPKVFEELNSIKEQVKILKEEEQQKVRETSSWADKLFQTQKKTEEVEKWIEIAKKGKSGLIATTPP